MSDQLQASEIVFASGSWSGHLFENPLVNYPRQLTWSFEFQCDEVSRDYGTSSVSVAIDWVRLPNASWRKMARRSATSPFAGPIEGSVYFFEHYRFEETTLTVLGETSDTLEAVARLEGDVDGLGLDVVQVGGRLAFSGITVQLEEVGTVEQAVQALASLTDVDGLVAEPGRTSTFHFVPGSNTASGRSSTAG